jgi:GTP-binding protein EngB required for normal cell division
MLTNPDFFKTAPNPAEGEVNLTDPKSVPATESAPEEIQSELTEHFEPDTKLNELIEEARKVLLGGGLNNLVTEVDKIKQAIRSEGFKISVIGEFSRGKSTLINGILGRELLPTGMVPMTALPTRILYQSEESIIHKAQGMNRILPCAQETWNEFTVENKESTSSNESLFVGLSDPWLEKTGITIIDTPGAGDLDEERALALCDAILCSDGVIITISAETPLTLSERTFIEERVHSAKIPCVMLVVTHLDRVRTNERAAVLNYINARLQQMKINVPVFIPQADIVITDTETEVYCGIDAIKNQMEKWLCDTDFNRRKRISVCASLLTIFDTAMSVIAEAEKLASLEKDKLKSVLQEKKLILSDYAEKAEALEINIENRCAANYEWLDKIVRSEEPHIIERLSYSVSHSHEPDVWWREDYPYQLKTSLENLARSFDSELNKHYTKDLAFVNQALNKYIKGSLDSAVIDNENIGEYTDFDIMDIGLEDIGKKKVKMRIGTAVVTVAGLGLSIFTGIYPILLTIGLGTAGSLLTEKQLKNTVKEQQETIKVAIANDVPFAIQKALNLTEQKLHESYSLLAEEAKAVFMSFIDAQKNLIMKNYSVENAKTDVLTKEPVEAIIAKIKKTMED